MPPSPFANVWKIVYCLNFEVVFIFITWTKNFQKKTFKTKTIEKQAGAELCQAQVKLEVVVEVGVEFGVELETCHN